MEEGVLVRIAVTKKILWKKAIESKSQVLHLVWFPNICWLTRKCRSHKILYLVSANIGVAQPKGRFPKKKTDILLDFVQTRSYAALRAVDLDWIVRPGYSWGGYILGCSQRLASCLRHSAQIGAGSQLTFEMFRLTIIITARFFAFIFNWYHNPLS